MKRIRRFADGGHVALSGYLPACAGLALREGPHFILEIGSVESFERRMDELQKGLPLAARARPSQLAEALLSREMLLQADLEAIFGKRLLSSAAK
jgi:hypothetical protein